METNNVTYLHNNKCQAILRKKERSNHCDEHKKQTFFIRLMMSGDLVTINKTTSSDLICYWQTRMQVNVNTYHTNKIRLTIKLTAVFKQVLKFP